MTISFACQVCHKKLKISDKKAGKQATCPACGHFVIVPTQASDRWPVDDLPPEASEWWDQRKQPSLTDFQEIPPNKTGPNKSEVSPAPQANDKEHWHSAPQEHLPQPQTENVAIIRPDHGNKTRQIIWAIASATAVVALLVGWYVYRANDIRKQDEHARMAIALFEDGPKLNQWVAGLIIPFKPFRLNETPVTEQEKIAEANYQESVEVYRKAKLNVKARDEELAKRASDLAKNVHDLWGIEVDELLFRYFERYPWLKFSSLK